MKAMTRLGLSAIALLWLTGATLAQTQAHEIRLNFVPDKTSVNFTLGDVLHTVHGSFTAKGGTIQFDPASNKISGEILVDAASISPLYSQIAHGRGTDEDYFGGESAIFMRRFFSWSALQYLQSRRMNNDVYGMVMFVFSTST
jgi:hypothetical protein